jgi:manganese/iron transport system permease protein
VLEALDAPYLQRALAAGLLLSVPFGLVGGWVVLRGQAFFAHGVGVATLPGVAAGLLLPVGPFVGALAAALAFSAAVSAIEADERLRGGAVTGLALATALALGSILLAAGPAGSVPAQTALFGSLLGISAADVLRCAGAAALALLVLGLSRQRLVAATFDPDWAAPAGARPAPVHLLLLVLVAVVVVCALPVAGSLLVSGLLVVPAASARLLTERLPLLLGLAVLGCGIELVGGLLTARALDLPPGATVSVLAGAGFALAAASRWLLSRGAVVRRLRVIS